MKKVMLVMSMLLINCNTTWAQAPAQQSEDNCQKWEQADKKLNLLYKQVLTLYASKPVFLKTFKASQLAWLKFRDAQVDALYPTQPGQSKQATYGSVYPSCNCAHVVLQLRS